MYKEKMPGHTNLVTKKSRRNTKKWLKITIHQKTVTTLPTRIFPIKMHQEMYQIRMHTERTVQTRMHTEKTAQIKMQITKMQWIKMHMIMEMKATSIKKVPDCPGVGKE